MRFLLIPASLFFISCNLHKQENVQAGITGDWLVLYAEHNPVSRQQREIYGRLQDSIIVAKGLKFISFFEDGSFRQMDSLHTTKGSWEFTGDKKLYVSKGGNGFEDFRADFSGYSNKELQVIEYCKVEGESIQLIWHLKKLSEPGVYVSKNTTWRQRPARQETDRDIKLRLSAMLDYYSDYYRLVAKESSYFIRNRVLLPFNYYQHGMGMKPYNSEEAFSGFFFNNEQSAKAYEYLDKAMFALKNKFPREENFVKEYAVFMKQMSREVLTVE